MSRVIMMIVLTVFAGCIEPKSEPTVPPLAYKATFTWEPNQNQSAGVDVIAVMSDGATLRVTGTPVPPGLLPGPSQFIRQAQLYSDSIFMQMHAPQTDAFNEPEVPVWNIEIQDLPPGEYVFRAEVQQTYCETTCSRVLDSEEHQAHFVIPKPKEAPANESERSPSFLADSSI